MHQAPCLARRLPGQRPLEGVLWDQHEVPALGFHQPGRWVCSWVCRCGKSTANHALRLGRGTAPTLTHREGRGGSGFTCPDCLLRCPAQSPQKLMGVWVGRCEDQEQNLRANVPVRGQGCLLHVCSGDPGPGWLGLTQQRTAAWVAPTAGMDCLVVLSAARSRCPQGWLFLETPGTLPAAGGLLAVMAFRGAWKQHMDLCLHLRAASPLCLCPNIPFPKGTSHIR